MKNAIKIAGLFLLLAMFSCESSEDISNSYDHEVPSCSSLTITANGSVAVIPDSVVSKYLWGYVPEVNLEAISLPTVTASKGSVVDVRVTISDNVALKTAELSYASWLFSKYINFANPVGDIPETPQTYTLTVQVPVPDNAVSDPWIETFYFNDGSTMKYIQSYHKLVLTLVDVNMNSRTVPIFIKIN